MYKESSGSTGPDRQTRPHAPRPPSPSSSGPGGSHGVPAPRRAHPAAPWSGGLAAAVPKTREFAIETEKPRRETRILQPPKRRGGGGNGASHSPTTELSFPTLRRAAQSPTPHRSLASPSPALQATRGGGGGGGEGQPDGHPLHLGRHVGASQSRLQVGIHHGLTVRRLDVVGGFLELQQHGHLRGAVHGTQPRSPRPPKLPTPESSSTE